MTIILSTQMEYFIICSKDTLYSTYYLHIICIILYKIGEGNYSALTPTVRLKNTQSSPLAISRYGRGSDKGTKGVENWSQHSWYTLLLVLIVLFRWLRHIVIASGGCGIGPWWNKHRPSYIILLPWKQLQFFLSLNMSSSS